MSIWTLLQYSKAANNSKELEDCEQASKLGAVNSTLRYAVIYDNSNKGAFCLSCFCNVLVFVLHSFHSPLESKCEMMQEHLKVKMLSRLFFFKLRFDIIWKRYLTASTVRGNLQINPPFFYFYQYQSLFFMTVLD